MANLPSIETVKTLTTKALIELFERIFCICGNQHIIMLQAAILGALEERNAEAIRAYKYDCYVCEFDEPQPELREYFRAAC